MLSTLIRTFSAFVIFSVFMCTQLTAGENFSGQELTNEDKEFILALKNAVASENISWVVDHVSLPISVYIQGEQRAIESKAEFERHYDGIFNLNMKDVILQQNQDAFKNYSGIMIGKGEIWFDFVFDDGNVRNDGVYQIIAINNK